MSATENNRRIAKNTFMLYIRMLLTMGVSLYTVRVVLDTLGIIDYGIYNVVGGVVTMFSFLSGTMASASQRFFAFEIGKNNMEQLKKTFSMTMNIYIVLGIVILILAETVGLWFLNHRMTIPPDRIVAAHWVYQFAVLSFLMTMFTIPYDASIIAHEKMNVYAWVSIIEVTLKLLIVYLLVLFPFDKLKLYAVLMFGVTTIVTFIYRTYCIKKFEECHLSFYWEKTLFKELFSYSGWNLFGALASIFSNQGVNIILNIFFGPVVNSARAIAYRINSTISQFVQNFMTATRPQIIKYYASGENVEMLNLVFLSSKISYYLLFILSMPVLLETNFIFNIWLKEVPNYTILFTRLIIITALIDSLSFSLKTAAQATGKIKVYQATVGSVMLITLPLSYFLYKMNYPVETIFYLTIANSIICLFLRLEMLKRMIGLSVTQFVLKVVLPTLLVSCISYILPFFLMREFEIGILRFVIIILSGFLTTAASIYILGLSKNERQPILQTIKKIKIFRS
ncbi:hypothetical protein PbJCM13498_28290 [Prolixibacter bellariivorans]|uniref:Lipopolysaccharide biosynthesis protein n=1 Tax=Prolixibacter bellariivorans TaxID=314319 RepID=A0A5M4B246_9BACT|nr:oligosaccharide flippase family protein [Prolixibacter bellariivorans]GET33966.1 hypothetical protein PbJCM13498_28290 [Prolixibacter bellariivorans]